jgi:ribosomal protein L37AE/L43A
VIEKKEGKVKTPPKCKTCGHTPIQRVVEWVKCKKCDKLFGKTRTGMAWKFERAFHMVNRHGANFEKEMEKM